MKKSAFPATPVPRQYRPNVLPLKGEIDLHVSPGVTQSLNAMTEEKPERIVIDLSGATYIDSAGLAALILPCKRLKATVVGFS
jgi:anti-anti-sigma factor